MIAFRQGNRRNTGPFLLIDFSFSAGCPDSVKAGGGNKSRIFLVDNAKGKKAPHHRGSLFRLGGYTVQEREGLHEVWFGFSGETMF